MAAPVIANPILNSPFSEPDRHFVFNEEGITDKIADGRRDSGYFLPIASPRKKGGQLKFETEWTQDRKRVPHVTLKSIANNPEIKEGVSRQEIDVAILRHADTELLYDKPYEDHKKIRVTGPFTVESLSPHRVLSTDDERPRAEQEGQRDSAVGQFETMILDNLRKAGLQNTVKNERLVFDRLEPLAGSWLQVSGSYTDAAGKPRRVAISIGPEHGTVGPNQNAYFTGADEPYEKLKRALKTEIDEAAWSTLYSTVSRPFAPPETGRIAVKVINHYGDEVLKVFEV